MADILQTLILSSYRAANVARSSCSEMNVSSLLLAEKSGTEANSRFDKDFKTIADVLAQESAKKFIIARHPELADYIRGEECSIMNGIKIELQGSIEGTATLLSQLIPLPVAQTLAVAAHRKDTDLPNVSLPSDLPAININEIGVWIDPIDATGQYIAGARGEADSDYGLKCVTVLIGAYLRSTGEPVIGVINQPFYDNGKGRLVWGMNYGDTKKWHAPEPPIGPHRNVILMSKAENLDIIKKITKSGWDTQSPPGAGYKLLQVILGKADAYILSKGTTFRWDTCAPHAILRAKGGDIIYWDSKRSITYNDPMNVDTQQYCNLNGIIAYKDPITLEKLAKLIAG